MDPTNREHLLAHLEIQARTMAAQAALAQLDDSKTDALLPEIRNQLAMINETLLSLGVYGAAARVSSSDTDV
jgi:hypothetical protein